MRKDPFGDPAFQAAVRLELDRIEQVDALHSGLASTATLSPDDILAALRAMPSGSDGEAFVGALRKLQQSNAPARNGAGPGIDAVNA